MNPHEDYMQLCIELARKGAGKVAPNPLVGCVLVYQGQIIGRGWHRQYGGPHAEVHAIADVADPYQLAAATLYVNLEPCAHFGKTPPCADLIISKKIPRVVIGCTDPNPLVGGKGIEKLRAAGIEVITGVLEKECRELNADFIARYENPRPHIILKWAESADGFIDHDRNVKGNFPAKISSPDLDKWVHVLRSKADAIMVGTETALADDPQLTVRLAEGKNPLRIVLDRELRLPMSLHLFDGTVPTLVFTGKTAENRANLEYVTIDFNADVLKQVLRILYNKHIRVLMVEGGSKLLSSFISEGYWDDAYILKGTASLGGGVPAPVFDRSAPDAAGPGHFYFKRK